MPDPNAQHEHPRDEASSEQVGEEEEAGLGVLRLPIICVAGGTVAAFALFRFTGVNHVMPIICAMTFGLSVMAFFLLAFARGHHTQILLFSLGAGFLIFSAIQLVLQGLAWLVVLGMLVQFLTWIFVVIQQGNRGAPHRPAESAEQSDEHR